jgi:hypothetical protein
VRAILKGGQRDGIVIDIPGEQASIRIPVIDHNSHLARALTMEEFADPANWEIDPLDGRLRRKRPPIGSVEYQRTDEIENDCVVFR